MPDSLRAGIATSALQVVGLHDPPRKTSTGVDEGGTSACSSLSNFLQSSTLLNDFVLRSSLPGKLQFVLVLVSFLLVIVFSFVSLSAATSLSSRRELSTFVLSQ